MINYLTDLVYPHQCCVCTISLSKQEQNLCVFCLSELPVTRFWTYTQNPVFNALRGRANIEYAFSYLFYTSGNITSQLIHDFKYHGVKTLGKLLSTRFARELDDQNWFSNYDVILPVPLHRRKMVKRGFNQSYIIAQAIATQLKLEVVTDVLVKKRNKDSQTKKSRFGRWRNMENLYAVKNFDKIRNKRVLLVDDVFTTGATTEACINALQKATPIAISVVTLAYTE